MSRATAMTPEDRRAAIIEAVTPLLLARGTDLTTRQLAEAAGVAEGTLFRVFESKQELLSEAAHAALHTEPALQQIAELPPANLTARVSAVLEILQAECVRTRTLSVMLLRPTGPQHHTPGHDPRHLAFRDRRQRLADAVTVALEDYTSELAVPPRTAARVLLAMAFAMSFDPTDIHPLTGQGGLADLVLHGIAQGNR